MRQLDADISLILKMAVPVGINKIIIIQIYL